MRRIERDDGAPYLDRYYLFGKEPPYFPEPVKTIFGFLPFIVFLHHFRDSDRDPELHNHPWGTSFSIVLAGGYEEERRVPNLDFDGMNRLYFVVRRVLKPFRVNLIRANDFHRVELLEADAWTLFFTGKRIQSWGFWSRITGEFVPYREFIEWRKARREEIRNGRERGAGRL